MKFEYEIFSTLEDLLSVAGNSYSIGIRQISTLFVYDEYVMYYSPNISGEGGESLWIVSMARGNLPTGLVEFDPETKKVEKITRAVNPEKIHFLVVRPEKSTILDKAIEAMNRDRK